VRLVQHLQVEDDATVWIGTSPRSRKVSEIRRNGAVTYAVEDREAFAYVALRGSAELVGDDRLRRALWEPGLQAFFPGGPGGDDFILVRITAVHLEVMSFSAGVHPEPYGLRAATVPVPRAGQCHGE
jgi:general stress protein 26